MTEIPDYREREREARRRAGVASSAMLRAIYDRVAVRYRLLADCAEIARKAPRSRND